MNSMEVKVSEDKQKVTLSNIEDFLEFLGDLEGFDELEVFDDNASSSSHDLQVGLGESKHGDPVVATAKPTKPGTSKSSKKRKTQPGYSTQFVQRKRAEAVELTRQIVVLEDWLERLKRPRIVKDERGAPVGHPKQGGQSWASTALEEFRKLHMAETVNRKLKAIQAAQVKLSKDVLGVIQKESALSESDFILSTRPTARTALTSVDNSHVLVRQLAQSVPQLYALSKTVFSSRNLPSFGCSMKPTEDVSRGKIIEIVGRVPVEHSIKETSDLLWRDLCRLCSFPDKTYRYRKEQGPDAVAKSFDLTIRSPSGTASTLGVQYLHRFEEKDRTVHVRMSKLLLPTEGLQLCYHSVAVISKAATEQCEVQFYMQVFVERQKGFSAAENDVKFIQENVLNTWAMKLRSHWLWLQELVTEDVVVMPV